MDLLLDEHQTANTLRLSVRTLQRLRRSGGGPRYFKIGRLVRYRIEAVEEYLSGCSRLSTSEGASPK